jgi:transposase-like protein
MDRESIDLLEFQRRFTTEDTCRANTCFASVGRKALSALAVAARSIACRSRHLYQCKSCRYQASLTAGTVFHKTHMPLQKWFWAIFLVAHDKGGCSAVRLSQQLDTRLETAWLMLHKIRAAMGQRESQ